MIKNLIFDFGKVLVDYNFMPVIDSFFGPDKEREQRFIDCMLSPYWNQRLDMEETSFGEIMAKMKQVHPDLADAIQLFDDRYLEFITGEIPGMRQLLIQLKANGYKLYGLSNWCSKVYATMEEYKEIFGLLDGYVVSSAVHQIKPHADIYETLFKKFDLIPSECLFTDDRAENIEGSIQVGMPAILFENAEQYKQALSAYQINI